jgi:lipoate---protein ligase
MTRPTLPALMAPLLKNDALFLRLAAGPLPGVSAYAQQEREVVYGPACRVAREVHTDRCEADQIPIARRRGGGGVVLLAEGMAVVVAAGERRGKPVDALHAAIQAALLDVLNPRCEKRLRAADKGDLAIGERKVLGSSIYLSRGPELFFYQASLLVSPDLALLDHYLAHPLREPAYRAGRPHADFCTSLRNEGITLTCAEAVDALTLELPEALRRRLAV